MAKAWPPPTAPRKAPISRIPYLPGLDGLRALAVVAVMLYHAGVSWMPGGFLGVEVFFVISGYLITLLLIGEQERRGRLSLSGFWARRARRLLPALIALLVAVATVSAVLPYLSESLAKLRDELFWGFFYGSNWFQINENLSYFDNQGRPQLLRHLWSLAVEEQFYIVWPLVMVVVLRVFRERLPKVGLAFFVAALASTVWMMVLYDPLNPNRVYLGTDTRAGGLLLGAALATVWRPYAIMRSPLRTKGRILDLVGLAGLLMLALTHWKFHDVVIVDGEIRGYDALYRGGFLLVGLATVMVIACTTHLRSFLGQRVLGIAPLVWLGTRSYGLYLWHWPVFMLLRPGAVDEGGDVDWPGWLVMAVRFAVTFALAEASFRMIERPFRERTVMRWIRSLQKPVPARIAMRRRRVFVGLAVVLLLPVFAGYQVATAKDRPSEVERSLAANEDAVHELDDILASTTPTTTTTPTVSGSDGDGAAGSNPTEPDVPVVPVESVESVVPEPTTTLPPETTTTAAPVEPIPMLAIGDSVMLGAASKLAEQGVWVDAKVGRQFKEGVELVTALNAGGLLGDVLVVHLGNNGPSTRERFDELMAQTTNVRLVVVLTVKVPKPWQGEVNTEIFDLPNRYPNVRLIDWNGLSQSQEGIFYSDGIHLRPAGQEVYTQLVMQTIAAG
ncbi:MAG TPA: acyltransferase family protein [Actinomycetota bacterium]